MSRIASVWSTPFFSKDGDILGTFAVLSHETRRPDQAQLRLADRATHTPAEFAARDITVQTRHEAVALDTQAGRVTVRNLETGKDTTLSYDLLMYATGSTAFVPPIAGRDLAGVHVLHTLNDAQAVRHRVAAGAQHAVVVGGDTLALRWLKRCTSKG